MQIIEIFESLQGEGPRIGVPSLFIRFCGCNMRCMFNCKTKKEKDELQKKWQEIENNKKINQLKDCPLLNYGCDSYPAILPFLKERLSQRYTIEQLIDIIQQSKCVDVVFTGGEPFLWWDSGLKEVCQKIYNKNIWFETNGTLPVLRLVSSSEGLNFVISPKIDYMDPAQLDTYTHNLSNFLFNNANFFLKFVINQIEDVKKLSKFFMPEKTYLMAQGSQYDEEFLKLNQQLADECIKYGCFLSFRLQNLLWKNEWGK